MPLVVLFDLPLLWLSGAGKPASCSAIAVLVLVGDTTGVEVRPPDVLEVLSRRADL